MPVKRFWNYSLGRYCDYVETPETDRQCRELIPKDVLVQKLYTAYRRDSKLLPRQAMENIWALSRNKPAPHRLKPTAMTATSASFLRAVIANSAVDLPVKRDGEGHDGD